MPYSTFEELEACPIDDLLAVLAAGDARERVWATWALGLRLDAKVVPLLSRLLSLDPDGGTRRHATVMMAGLAPLDAVARTAGRDRDPRVRATALGLLGALAAAKDPRLLDVVGERLCSGSEDERVAILDRLPSPVPALVRPLVLAQLSHSSEAVRAAASGAVVRDPSLLAEHGRTLPTSEPPACGRGRGPAQSAAQRYPLLVRPFVETKAGS